MPEREKEQFTVVDKRKFNPEGEFVGTDEPARPQPESAAPAPAPPQQEEPLAPPTAQEQSEGHAAYEKSGKQLDDLLHQHGVQRPADFEMTFDKLVRSLYTTAILQLGLVHAEGQEPRADLVGARQTIDTLGILSEKTRGNLTDRESSILQNALFELRMAFLEITNAITQAPPPGAPQPPRK
jgi:hypothetical protein